MARRRLLTLLATTALLTGVLAGPATALELDDPSAVTTPVQEVVEEAADLTGATPAPAAVEESVEETPLAPAPAAEPRSTAPATSSQEPDDDGTASNDGGSVVAAGGVISAPPIDFLISLGGSEQTPGRAASTPLGAPASAPAPAADQVEAPMVAPAPAAPPTSAAPSVLAQAVDGLPEEGAPGLALVALAALLAAGASTVRTARIEAAA